MTSRISPPFLYAVMPSGDGVEGWRREKAESGFPICPGSGILTVAESLGLHPHGIQQRFAQGRHRHMPTNNGTARGCAIKTSLGEDRSKRFP